MPTVPPTGSPIGFFVPSPGVGDPVSPMIADDIDPETHDYKSILEGADTIDAQVLIALKVFRGSGSAVTADGQTFRDIDKLTDDVATIIESDVRRALDRLLRNRDIRLVATGKDEPGIQVVVFSEEQAAEVIVRYRNLRSLDSTVRTVRFRTPEQI
jgi:hypothetical protein